jgi:hypothetical protein
MVPTNDSQGRHWISVVSDAVIGVLSGSQQAMGTSSLDVSDPCCCRIRLYGIKSAASGGADEMARVVYSLPFRSGSASCARPVGRARAGRTEGRR